MLLLLSQRIWCLKAIRKATGNKTSCRFVDAVPMQTYVQLAGAATVLWLQAIFKHNV